MCRYSKASDIFESVAERSLDNHLLKFGVKGHLLNAGVCHIARGDSIALENAIRKYQVVCGVSWYRSQNE